jgi:hypothetical protein
MAKNLGEALVLLNRLGQFDLLHLELNMEKKDTVHYVAHKFKEDIIIPYIALSNNLDYLLCDGKKTIHTKDGVMCECVSYEHKHIFEMEEDIKTLYGIETYDFLKRWYNFDNAMQSLYFIKMKLKKIE